LLLTSSCGVQTVRELFDSKDCPKVLSCEFAGGSCWYVTFANEPDAQAAYRHLRENVGSFRNTPIMVGILSMLCFYEYLFALALKAQYVCSVQ